MKIESIIGDRKLWRVLLCAIIFNFQFSIFNLSQAQVAGLNTLTILDMSNAGRTAGLGFDYLPIYDVDLSVGIDNPSLIVKGMGGTGMLSYVSLFGGGRGLLSYGHNTKRLGTFVFSFHFNNYGSFTEYDEEENELGRFTASDYVLSVGWGVWLDSCFSVGVNFKPVLSQYASYTAIAAVFDVAGSFTSNNRRFTASVVGRNIGAQLLTFDGTVERLPFELSAAMSYKLVGAPFRFYFAATELQRWDLRYDDPFNPTTVVDPFTGEVSGENWLEGTLDNLLRHTLLGVEISLGRSLFARVGYSYRQNAEMRGVDAFNLSGFSFGVGLRTKRFEFSFAHRDYHLSQAPNYLTLSYRF